MLLQLQSRLGFLGFPLCLNSSLDSLFALSVSLCGCILHLLQPLPCNFGLSIHLSPRLCLCGLICLASFLFLLCCLLISTSLALLLCIATKVPVVEEIHANR